MNKCRRLAVNSHKYLWTRSRKNTFWDYGPFSPRPRLAFASHGALSEFLCANYRSARHRIVSHSYGSIGIAGPIATSDGGTFSLRLEDLQLYVRISQTF